MDGTTVRVRTVAPRRHTTPWSTPVSASARTRGRLDCLCVGDHHRVQRRHGNDSEQTGRGHRSHVGVHREGLRHLWCGSLWRDASTPRPEATAGHSPGGRPANPAVLAGGHRHRGPHAEPSRSEAVTVTPTSPDGSSRLPTSVVPWRNRAPGRLRAPPAPRGCASRTSPSRWPSPWEPGRRRRRLGQAAAAPASPPGPSRRGRPGRDRVIRTGAKPQQTGGQACALRRT